MLFAMERLSVNPYTIRRLHPVDDTLPYQVEDQVVKAITGTSLSNLHHEGRLFTVDHSYQRDYPVSPGTYIAGCEAYFFLDIDSEQLLPLAIKAKAGAEIIYTPMDNENDWLLAKAMFNQNDLFNNGEAFDRVLAANNHAARKFATDFYPTVAGPFRSNYFETDLRNRGLLNCSYGPQLPDVPFYEDGHSIIAVIRRFVNAYLEAYYGEDPALALDWELQAWVTEANDVASVIDFHSGPLVTLDALIDIIKHIAWLTGVSHHVLNSGEPVATSGTLPLHPAALYVPPPLQNGVQDLMPFLPNAQKAVEQIALVARFNRPQLEEKQQTLLHMFNYEPLLERAEFANERFMTDMRLISDNVQKKRTDPGGLCQGMPFVWKEMDPSIIPFFLSA